MLVKELDFVLADVNKLSRYANMTIEEYADEIESQLNRGESPNLFYKDIYEKLIQKGLIEKKPEPVEEKKIDPIMQCLSEIPIQEIQYYVPSSIYTKTINQLNSKGIKNMSQLASFEPKGNTKLEYIKNGLQWKQYVMDNAEMIISNWKEANSIKTIPSSYDPNLGIVVNFRNAIIEYAQIIMSRLSDKRYYKSPTSSAAQTACLLANILLLAYRDGYNDDEIKSKVSSKKVYTRERIRNLRSQCIARLLRKGQADFENVTLHQDIVTMAKSFEDECMFRPLSVYENYCGSKELDFLPEFGFDVVNVGDDSFLVPLDKKMIYNKVIDVVTDILLDSLLPEEKDSIVQYVSDSRELENVDYNPAFVTNVLESTSFVDMFEDGTIQIKNKFLTNAQRRFVRIIYNAKTKITKDEILRRYEEEYKVTPTATPSTDPNYNICCESKKLWYYGEPLTPIKEIIKNYAEKNKVFYYSEIVGHLESCGYSVLNSIRTKITDLCCVDNKDNNHFCHKDYVDEYSSFSWRNPTIYGQANWMLKETQMILREQVSIDLDKLISMLINKAVGTDYEEVVKKRAKYVIPTFCGDGFPFLLMGNTITKNEPYFSETEFATIGLKEGKYAFFSQIRSIASNEAKRSENGKVSLNDIMNVVNDTIAERLSRNVVIRAIEDKDNRFAPIDIKLITEDGNRYVVWTKQEIKAEPTFQISAVKNEEDVELVERIEDEIRPGIKYRQIVDWDKLNQALKRELSFYKHWMLREEFDLNASIDKFLSFLSHSDNTNLNKKLPQCLYEYWFASTDSFDRSTYLANLALFFEAFLAEIYYREKGIKLRKNGLSDWAEEFDGLSEKMSYNRESKGFDRIASDLHYKRNKIAHGDGIELSSLETAKTITDFVALYVYVIARYLDT